jgi:hypothetical protein
MFFFFSSLKPATKWLKMAKYLVKICEKESKISQGNSIAKLKK